MRTPTSQHGFSLVELLVAATIFTFVVTGVSELFVQAIDLQRRASGVQKIEENAQFVIESIAREVRVSAVASGDASCAGSPGPSTRQLTILHPTNGAVTYTYDPAMGTILRNGQAITTSDVKFTLFAFCVSGSGHDGLQTRVTMPMTIESISGRPSARVNVSLQTTVVSRDLSTDF